MMNQYNQPDQILNRSMPPGTIIPELRYPDVRLAADWLCRAFGFQERLSIGNHRVQLLMGQAASMVVVQGGQTGAAPDSRWPQPGSHTSHSLMVRVADVDRHFEQARQSGARILRPPETHPFGERQYTVEDVGGHCWTFTQSVADVAPETWGGQAIKPG